MERSDCFSYRQVNEDYMLDWVNRREMRLLGFVLHVWFHPAFFCSLNRISGLQGVGGWSFGLVVTRLQIYVILHSVF